MNVRILRHPEPTRSAESKDAREHDPRTRLRIGPILTQGDRAMRKTHWVVLGVLVSVLVGGGVYLGEVGNWERQREHYLIVQTKQCEAMAPMVQGPRNCPAAAKSGTAWMIPAGRKFGTIKALGWVGIGWGWALIGGYAFRRCRAARRKSNPGLSD